MKQLVFRASERLLTFENKEFFHRNAGECGEGTWVGYEGETLLVMADLFIGDIWNGIYGVEGSGSRVVFALNGRVKMNKEKEMGGFRTSSSLLARLLAFFLIRPAEMVFLSSGRVDVGLIDGTAKSFDRGLVRPSSCLSLLCILEWRVNSSEREKRFSQPGKVQANGFSPVCVRMWRVFGGG